jgi:hypothetical protein
MSFPEMVHFFALLVPQNDDWWAQTYISILVKVSHKMAEGSIFPVGAGKCGRNLSQNILGKL